MADMADLIIRNLNDHWRETNDDFKVTIKIKFGEKHPRFPLER